MFTKVAFNLKILNGEIVKTIHVLNCKLDYLDTEQLNNIIKTTCNKKNKIRISNLNIHACNIAYENEWYKQYVNDSAVVHCDGKGIQLAVMLLLKKPPVQITYHTWSWQLFKFCNDNELSVFFLGSEPETLKAAMKIVNLRYPKLKLGGHHGFFQKTGSENNEVINVINEFQPNVLMVGLGMPLQENWIKENEKLVNANIFLNGGAFMDWISGKKKMAPSILTKMGLEWFYRLTLEPKRLFRRYIIGIPKFFIRLIGHHYFGLRPRK